MERCGRRARPQRGRGRRPLGDRGLEQHRRAPTVVAQRRRDRRGFRRIGSRDGSRERRRPPHLLPDGCGGGGTRGVRRFAGLDRRLDPANRRHRRSGPRPPHRRRVSRPRNAPGARRRSGGREALRRGGPPGRPFRRRGAERRPPARGPGRRPVRRRSRGGRGDSGPRASASRGHRPDAPRLRVPHAEDRGLVALGLDDGQRDNPDLPDLRPTRPGGLPRRGGRRSDGGSPPRRIPVGRGASRPVAPDRGVDRGHSPDPRDPPRRRPAPAPRRRGERGEPPALPGAVRAARLGHPEVARRRARRRSRGLRDPDRPSRRRRGRGRTGGFDLPAAGPEVVRGAPALRGGLGDRRRNGPAGLLGRALRRRASRKRRRSSRSSGSARRPSPRERGARTAGGRSSCRSSPAGPPPPR